MSGRLNKAKKFYSSTEKSSLKVQDPISIVRTMVKELQNSMNKVIISTGKDNERFVRSKYFSRSLVIIYTLQTTLDFEKGEKLAIKLFQIYEFCRKQLIKCFKEQVVEGTQKAINALDDIFSTNMVKTDAR
ncbi:MAG: flagellar biosynthesis protein FliS [Alphaproteobacteria bacterium]|nr:flagellar biosynthesis protein FliS [Alphaproteobacteria bacterium]|tara:strand:+ start:522 stop:914 length:393 start_codon:yes stop_codon:yes gene_type:complete